MDLPDARHKVPARDEETKRIQGSRTPCLLLRKRLGDPKVSFLTIALGENRRKML